MGMKIPLTGGQFRLVIVTVVICVAIYLILYASAAFQTTTTEPHHRRNGIDDSAAHTKEHVFLRARWKNNRIIDTEEFQRDSKEGDRGQHAGRSRDHKDLDSSDILVGNERTSHHGEQGQSEGHEKSHAAKLIGNSDKSLNSSRHRMASPHHHASKTKVKVYNGASDGMDCVQHKRW